MWEDVLVNEPRRFEKRVGMACSRFLTVEVLEPHYE